ncbi:MAG TPA: DUF5694 domain-containing protein [Rhizomicrobium sp.]
MRLSRLVLGLLLLAVPLGARAADAPAQVMIVGVFHMSNPGKDLHNLKVDDVLSPERQAQIKSTVDAIAAFKPTMVDVEWDKDTTNTRYDAYRKGTLAPSRNEVVQLGFRLAQQMNLLAVNGVDAYGDFPYDAVQAFAKAHGEMPLLDAQSAAVDGFMATMGDTLKTKGVAATLRFLNDPATIARSQDFYRTTLKLGSGSVQPGADLLTAWYRRNFLICANIVQLARPGDRVVVFFGSGHAFLLRQCIGEMPGFMLVEPNAYLPQ